LFSGSDLQSPLKQASDTALPKGMASADTLLAFLDEKETKGEGGGQPRMVLMTPKRSRKKPIENYSLSHWKSETNHLQQR